MNGEYFYENFHLISVRTAKFPDPVGDAIALGVVDHLGLSVAKKGLTGDGLVFSKPSGTPSASWLP